VELKEIRRIIIEKLNLDDDTDITLETSFVDDLEADSISLVELIMGLEDEYGIEIEDEDAEKIKTVQDAIDYLLIHKTVLVHGDYSPKNILVSDNGIFILDFEVAHWGNPVFDLAFLTNHLLLKSVKNKRWIV